MDIKPDGNTGQMAGMNFQMEPWGCGMLNAIGLKQLMYRN